MCGLYMYVEQVSLWRGCEGGLLMVWTKWVMTKVVVQERVLIDAMKYVALCLVINESGMTC